MTTLSVQVQNFAEAQQMLLRVQNALRADLILDESAALIFNRIRTRFTQNVNPDGIPWPQSKAAQKRGTITLYDTGRLFNSLQLFSVGPNTRAIGTDVPYAKYHNEGSGRLPKRQFLGFGDDDVSLAVKVIERRIQDAIR